jgi:aldoxime dehydratase
MSQYHVEYPRTVAERRPPDFTPAVPRYSLRWNHPVPLLVAQYFGLQGQEVDGAKAQDFLALLERSFAQPHGPEAFEIFTCPADEVGQPATVVVAYWTDASSHARWRTRSTFEDWWRSSDRLHDGVGYWRETILCPYDRHETVYSGPNYRIGFGRTRDVDVVPITTNGYFGAARDRIPLSAIDTLESPLGVGLERSHDVGTVGRRLAVVTPHNMAVLRSGQFWHDSEPEQADDYEQAMAPKLDRGMEYLAGRDELGCVFLRRLTNVSPDLVNRRETSVHCAIQDWRGLEEWSENHPTHHAIFNHAIAMGRKYGAKRDVVTWHEALILPYGNIFEYVNCAEGTGLTSLGAAMVLDQSDTTAQESA